MSFHSVGLKANKHRQDQFQNLIEEDGAQGNKDVFFSTTDSYIYYAATHQRRQGSARPADAAS
jgi:hypothetical protein